MRPSGAEALAGNEQRLVEILRDQVLARAARARTDIVEFIEFVMRDFTQKKPIRVSPHQRVGLDFIMRHERCVNMWPISSSKTFIMTALTLFKLGQNPELRGAVVSAAQGQAETILGLVRGYIESSIELKMVFPGLSRSMREGDPWTQTKLTVERASGIKDASLTAYGQDSKGIIGSRLNWVIVDDLLNAENTGTDEARKKVIYWLQTSVFSRLDAKGSHAVMTNTPWHPGDAVHEAERTGWATMRMDAYGDIIVFDDIEDERAGTCWDTPLLRPAEPNNPANPACRLVAHDPDPNNEVPLWPEKFVDPTAGITTMDRASEECRAWLDQQRASMLPQVFNQLFRSICRDDATSMCKVEYVDRCLKAARDIGAFTFVNEYKGANLTFTGVDLAFGLGEEHDDTALFTFEARPGGLNVILEIDAGKWDVASTVKKIHSAQKRFKSVVVVENNGGQDTVRQWALQNNLDLPVKAHHTGREKAHPEVGLPGIFLEMMNGAWAFPNTMRAEKHPHVERLIRSCLYYAPQRHADDVLMSMFLARVLKVQWLGATTQPTNQAGSGTSVMSR